MKAETSPSLDSFGARLALVRHYGDGVSTGWTVKRAADECGISENTWRSWERHGTKPSDMVDACQRISRRTGIDMMWLLLGPAGATSGNDGSGWLRFTQAGETVSPFSTLAA